MMKFLRNLFKRKRGQTFVEYALIAAAIGLVLAVASYQLFEGTKINFYHGLLPTNRERIDLPPAPDGTIPSGYSKPNAVIIGPSTVVLGSEVEYRSESYDHNGRIVRTSWGGNTTKIHFTYEGEYTLELTVWNDKGLSDTTTMTIKIVNNAPVAVIRANPDKDLVHTENVTLHLNDSYDPDGHRITNWEWKLNGQIVNWDKTRTGTLPVGTNTIQLRVADEFGKWSQWVTKTIKVNQNYKPVAVIKANPDRELIHTESVTIDANSSYDPDGDNITQYEWKLNGQSVSWGKSRSGTLPVGTNTIQLRVMDAYGQWSDWVSKTIVVKNNRPPVAVITMTPNSNITTSTTVTFSYTNSYDPDGDAIVQAEWQNKQSTYSKGTHTVRLRVKDANGLWSDWTSVTFTVTDPQTYSPPQSVSYNYKSGTTWLASSCDDCYYTVNLPFTFRFYDRTYNRVYVNNNGMLTFETGSSKWSNYPVSDPNTPDYSILAFWDDLDYRDIGDIYYGQGGTAPNRYFVVEFRNPNHFSRAGNGIHVSVVLYENGTVELSYKDVSFGLSEYNYGASATVGIKKNSSVYHQYLYNSPALSNGMTIRYNPQ